MKHQPKSPSPGKRSPIAVAAFAAGMILLAATLLVLALSVGFRRDGPTVKDITHVNKVSAQVGDGPAQEITLPYEFGGLAPRTKVTLTATIYPKIDDGVFIQTKYAPAMVYLDGREVFEFGKRENYPSFMTDPGMEVHIVEAYGDGSAVQLRVEYRSPSFGDTLSVDPFMVGTSKEGILERSKSFGNSSVLSMVQIVFGAALVLMFCFIRVVDKKATLFLWLGLFSIAVGMWAFGASPFSATVFRSSAMMYLLSFIGRFTLIIPFLYFMRELVPFRNQRLLRYTQLFFTLCALGAILLQLTGVLPFYRSVQWFNITVPLAMLLLDVLMVYEYVSDKSSVAKWFFLPTLVLTVSGFFDAFGYMGPLHRFFYPSFQFGSFFFLLYMGVTAGIAVRASINLRSREKELNFEKNLLEIQMEEQRNRSLLLARHEQELRRQRHDLRHQLVAIQELAGKENKELQGYLMALLDHIPTPARAYCENENVNAVVTHYADFCRQHDIDFTADLTVPNEIRHLPVGSLCVVFGNLLENAVEACGRMESGPKFIRIKSRIQYEMLTVTMDNSFDGRTKIIDGRYVSSKRDEYGIGLSSVRAVAEKSGGTAKFEADGYTFLSSVLINL